MTERSPNLQQQETDRPSKRHRAATACAYCRRRKAKCDNVRPQCGFCVRQRVACVYEDDNTAAAPLYDGATLEILARLDDVRSLLQHHGIGTSPTTRTTSATLTTNLEPVGGFSPPAIACESLLAWPVLADVLDEQQKRITSFLLDAPQVQLTNFADAHAANSAAEVDLNDVNPLCEKFLQFVHPRNPILEPEELLNLAQQVSNHGLTWDGASCLILVVCALARITTPWTKGIKWSDKYRNADDDKAAAEVYFHQARRRIGLLLDSITDLQCLFFASIYEKHAMRPLEAFQYLQQLACRLNIRRRTNLSQLQHVHDRKEVWLVFSCLKAQTELHPEIGMGSTFDSNLTLPDQLPQPPSNPSRSPVTHDEQVASPGESFGSQEERGWLFYLSEISLRRRIQESLALLYGDREAHWLQHTDELADRYETCQSQIDLWYSHLPAALKFDSFDFPQNEFAFYLQGRFYEWRTLLLRPFFFCQLHGAIEASGGPTICELARDYLEHCSAFVEHLAYHGRHGGTWFACRHAFAAGMSMLASVIAHDRITPPNHWVQDVRTALMVLKTWASEAADVATMADTLEKAHWEVCRRQMVNPLPETSHPSTRTG